MPKLIKENSVRRAVIGPCISLDRFVEPVRLSNWQGLCGCFGQIWPETRRFKHLWIVMTQITPRCKGVVEPGRFTQP